MHRVPNLHTSFPMKARILAVDDERLYLDLLERQLGEAGFEVIRAQDGMTALERLEENTDVQVVVLDRMMPHIDGMEVLRILKGDERFRHIPVIMQTASALSVDVEEGIRAGAYYYLTKPYDTQMLIGIVRAALRKSRHYAELRGEVRRHWHVLGLIEQARFRFRTLEEAKYIAYYIANCCPEPETVVFGLSELMINAVEHGNLGISFAEKTQLVLKGGWEQEVRRRLQLEENRDKYGTVNFESGDDGIAITIADKGAGFDWQDYLEFNPKRLTKPHGRGIAMANALCFAEMEYRGGGNEVVCRIPAEKAG